MIRNRTLEVSAAEDGMRVDRFVLLHAASSRRGLVGDAITRGTILRNNASVLKGSRLKAGDTVEIVVLYEQNDVVTTPNVAIALSVLHKDDQVIVVDKPPAMPVHPLKPWETDTLANGLVARFPEMAAVGGDPLFPAFVHRLDNDTSGVLVAARNDEAYKALRATIRERRFVKHYTALVRGTLHDHHTLTDTLMHDPDNDARMIIARGKGTVGRGRRMDAITHCTARKCAGKFTLLDIQIETGVMHQIRCQLAARGHPVAGDRIYGSSSARRAAGPGRHFLHASSVAFPHPATGDRVHVESPLPADLRTFLTSLGFSV